MGCDVRMAENYSIGDTPHSYVLANCLYHSRRLSSKQNIAMARLVIRILALLFTWQAISIEGINSIQKPASARYSDAADIDLIDIACSQMLLVAVPMGSYSLTCSGQ